LENSTISTTLGLSGLADGFKSAMRRLASSVAVVTAHGPDGPCGMAVTSITSVTLEPPTLLICLKRGSSVHRCLQQGTKFRVCILSRDQLDISAAFGGAVAGDRRFSVGDWRSDQHGCPALSTAQAAFGCEVESAIQYGSHEVVFGRVLDVSVEEGIDPLIYLDGRYL
jgi:flavin reductase (DIM6/NTAB) family NADH-FMN oxidoreductase RutF